MRMAVTTGARTCSIAPHAGSGGAAAGQNLEIADRCPVTETSGFYKFLYDVQRVVAAFLETLLSLSLFHRFRIPSDNCDFRHDSFSRTSTEMRSGISIGRYLRSNRGAISQSSHSGISNYRGKVARRVH